MEYFSSHQSEMCKSADRMMCAEASTSTSTLSLEIGKISYFLPDSFLRIVTARLELLVLHTGVSSR